MGAGCIFFGIKLQPFYFSPMIAKMGLILLAFGFVAGNDKEGERHKQCSNCLCHNNGNMVINRKRYFKSYVATSILKL